MTLEELAENQDELISFVRLPVGKGKQLLKEAGRPFLSWIIELIINIQQISINESEVDVIKQCELLTDYFSSHQTQTIESVRAFLSKNHSLTRGAVAYMLHKILEEAILCVYDRKENEGSENTCNWISFGSRFTWQNEQGPSH
jgi:hypothetical protein